MERERSVGKPTNELNDLRTRGVETWGQTQKVRMSDEEARRKKEAEKAKLQKKLVKATEDVEGSDESEASVEETDLTTPTSMLRKEKKREKKEAEKAKKETRGVEAWDQTQKVGEKE